MALRFWREKVVTTPQLSPGQRYNVELSQLQQTRDGRPVHVLGFELECAMHYSAAGGAGYELPGPFVRSVLSDIVLRSGDHRWIDSLDGDEVHALSELRRGQPFDGRGIDSADAVDAPAAYDQAKVQGIVDLVNEIKGVLFSLVALDRLPDPDPIADSAAANVARTETVRYLCSHLGASPWDGAIPLAALNERRGANRMEFSIASGFKGDGKYTIGDCTVTIYALLCTRDELRYPSPHKMRAYDEQRTDMVIRPEGRALAILIRDTRNANGVVNALDHDKYTQLTLTVDDDVIYQNATVAEIIANLNFRVPPGTQRFLSPSSQFIPLSLALPSEKRTNMHSGAFRLQIQGTRKDSGGTLRTSSRVLIHETGRFTDTAMTNAKRVVGAPQKGVMIEPRLANGKRDPLHPVRDVIDHAIYWPGMRGLAGEVPARKLAEKAQGKKAG